MQIRPPAPGSFQHPFGNSPSPMNPGLQSHPSHHQQMAAPMDLSSFLPAQNGYEDASQGLQSLLRTGASPMDLGIPQVSPAADGCWVQHQQSQPQACPVVFL